MVSALLLFAINEIGDITDQEAVSRIAKVARPFNLVLREANPSEFGTFGNAINHVTVVGLGECTHGSRDVFLAKAKMFRYLVENQGFRVLALESDFASTLDMDRFVTTGQGDATAALLEQGFWTWATEEVRDLLLWMHAYNSVTPPDRQLRVVGVDAQDSYEVQRFLIDQYKRAGTALPEMEDTNWFAGLTYENDADPKKLVPIMERHTQNALEALEVSISHEERLVLEHAQYLLSKMLWHLALISKGEQLWELRIDVAPHIEETSKKMPNLGAKLQLSAKSQEILDGVSDYVTSDSRQMPSLARLQSAEVELRAIDGESAQKAADVLRYVALTIELATNPIAANRDRNMAANVTWIQETFIPGSKVVFWGHNSHASRFEHNGRPFMMGAHLDNSIGSKYFPVGFVFNEGSFRASRQGKIRHFTADKAKPGSLGSYLAMTGKPTFFLSLNDLDPETYEWLKKPRPIRGIGASYDPGQPERYYEVLSATEMFDGLVFINRIRSSRALTRH
ncbi:MAG: erythromycin esterase family protein [Armatimonadetes bacterium]|nr:erythromycin esterase family protein [Armatimonadota bacterium]